MLWSADVAELHLIGSTIADGTRPSSTRGTLITPNQNDIATATWVSVLAAGSVTDIVRRLVVNANTIAVSAAARDGLVEVGFDPAGGSTYTHLAYLLMGPAAQHAGGAGGVTHDILCHIPASSTIGIRGSVNSATLTGFRASVTAYGMPSPSHLFRPARQIQDIGIATASSGGVAVTAGEAANGAWTSIGTLDFNTFAWEFGVGINASAMSANGYDVDIGVGDAAGSNIRTVIRRGQVYSTAAEATTKAGHLTIGRAKAGETVWARVQTGSSATPGGINVAVTAMGY